LGRQIPYRLAGVPEPTKSSTGFINKVVIHPAAQFPTRPTAAKKQRLKTRENADNSRTKSITFEQRVTRLQQLACGTLRANSNAAVLAASGGRSIRLGT
jgi:hypothetical protein